MVDSPLKGVIEGAEGRCKLDAVWVGGEVATVEIGEELEAAAYISATRDESILTARVRTPGAFK